MLKNKSSLYRIYRPSLFKDIAGHENIVEILQKELSDNSFGHAFLFSGQKGTGKTSIARIFAKAVNCENLQAGEPCEKCDHCRLANNGQAPDIYEIDAASNNGVDEIRNIKNNVITLPIHGRYKIYIIDEVHMLSKGAFNALLKTLEEPPNHALFILATTEFAKIPQTIVSRCQTFNFKKIDRQALTTRLFWVAQNEGFVLANDVADEIYFLSDGSLRDALNILEQLMIVSDKTIVLESLKKIFYVATKKEKIKVITDILAHNVHDLINYFENAENQGMDFDVFALSLIEIIKEIIEFKLTENITLLKVLNLEDFADLSGNLEDYFLIADQLCDAYAKTKGSNVNFNYLLINLLKATAKTQLPRAEKKAVEALTVHQVLNPENQKQEKIFPAGVETKTETLNLDSTPTALILENFGDPTVLQETSDLQLVAEKVKKNQPATTFALLEEKLKLIGIYGNQQSLKIDNAMVINLLVSAMKEKRDLVAQQIDSWFKADGVDNLLHPQSAIEFIAFSGAKISAASDCEILVRFETEAGANFLKKELIQKHYQNRLKEQLRAEYVFYPIDDDQWETVKREFLFKKKTKVLPVHNHQTDAASFYQNSLIHDHKDNNTKDFLKAANELFGDDVEIGD